MTFPRFAAVTCALAALPTAALAAEEPVGGAACPLIREQLPGEEAPLRSRPPFAEPFEQLAEAGDDAERLAAVHDRLREALSGLLEEAAEVFHPDDGEAEWAERHTERAQRFLQEHVLSEEPVLRIGRYGFEPQPGVRTALVWTACASGDREAAIAWGRRATGEAGADARALASLLLVAAERREEAAELLPTLDDEGFAGRWLRAELGEEAAARRAAHERAAELARTEAQRAAIRAQAERLREAGVLEPDEEAAPEGSTDAADASGGGGADASGGGGADASGGGGADASGGGGVSEAERGETTP